MEQLDVVVEADEVHPRGEPGPVGQRVVQRLHERRDHEDHEDRQRQAEEHDHEADPVEGQRPARAAGRRTGGPPPGTTAGVMVTW